MKTNPSQLPSATASKGPVIHFPTEEEEKRRVAEWVQQRIKIRTEMREAARIGLKALDQIVEVLRHNNDTGQAYKLRALLFSLWNGKPASLIEVVTLDWQLRLWLCYIIAGFGYEDKEDKFFYDATKQAFVKAGLWDWFLEEGGKEEP